MAYANLSRDGIAVLMADRNRLVVTVAAHYKNFPLHHDNGAALQNLQTAVSRKLYARRLTVIAGATVAPRAANGAPGTNLTNHAAHNTNQPTPPPLPRAVPNGIQATSAGAGKRACARGISTISAVERRRRKMRGQARKRNRSWLCFRWFQMVKEGTRCGV
jgi:hypothetical protein